MKKIYLIVSLIVVIVVGVAAVVAWREWRSSPAPERVSYLPARVSDIRSMVELQTVEIYEEMPFKAQIGPRHIVGRVILEGRIGFDLEKIEMTERGDTIDVTLPPATVTVTESTQPDSYRIYDAWSDRMGVNPDFTSAEENAMKRRLVESAVRNINKRGEPRQARQAAMKSVARLLSDATGRPVVCR